MTTSLCAAAAMPVAASAPGADAAAQKRALLKRGGLSPAEIRAVERDPGRLLRHLRVTTTVRDSSIGRTSRYPRRGCHRRRTHVNLGFRRPRVIAGWYRLSIEWCWDKGARRVRKSGPINTDYDLNDALQVAGGLRHHSDRVRTSGYTTWRGARRGAYYAEGELVVHVCPAFVEVGCSPTQRVIAIARGHYDGTVHRKGRSRS